MSDSSLQSRAKRDPAPNQAGGLSREVHTLTTVIKQLEEQLDQMMAANDALRKDQEDERARNLTLQSKVDELHDRLQRSEKQVVDKENLVAEVKHLNLERARLGASERELGAKLADMEQQRDRELRLVERLRAAHVDAVDDVQSVEAQFERAMQLVAQTRAQLTIAGEERDQLGLRAKAQEAQVAQLRQERDALLAEVEQSRAALDEIRRSLVDACLVSTTSAPGEAQAGAAR
jgi:uncharacterized coiled-coil DUF342 family protein